MTICCLGDVTRRNELMMKDKNLRLYLPSHHVNRVRHEHGLLLNLGDMSLNEVTRLIGMNHSRPSYYYFFDINTL